MRRTLQYLPIGLTATLLAAACVCRTIAHTEPADVPDYQRRVVETAAIGLADSFGGWVGTPAEVPPVAIAMLHPNVLLARHYRHLGTDDAATFVVVDCNDARDMLGHYPPACYGGQGWNLRSSDVHAMTIGSTEVNWTRYSFFSDGVQLPAELIVDDCMLLPNGRTCADMTGVEEMARNRRDRFYGAGQIQIVYDSATPAANRDRVFFAILQANRALIESILSRSPGGH